MFTPPAACSTVSAAPHVARPALRLHAGRGHVGLAVAERAVLDRPATAADHVDRRAAAAPALDGAALEPEVVQAGEFDPVMVPAATAVADRQVAQDDVVGRRLDGPGIVDVDPVRGRARDDQADELEGRRRRGAAAADHRWQARTPRGTMACRARRARREREPRSRPRDESRAPARGRERPPRSASGHTDFVGRVEGAEARSRVGAGEAHGGMIRTGSVIETRRGLEGFTWIRPRPCCRR